MSMRDEHLQVLLCVAAEDLTGLSRARRQSGE